MKRVSVVYGIVINCLRADIESHESPHQWLCHILGVGANSDIHDNIPSLRDVVLNNVDVRVVSYSHDGDVCYCACTKVMNIKHGVTHVGESMIPYLNWDPVLDRFCRLLGIEFTKPGWMIITSDN